MGVHHELAQDEQSRRADLVSPTQDNPVQALSRPRSPQTRSPHEQSGEHIERKSM